MNQIYLLHEKSRSNFKIGSTSNFNNRISGYITCCDYFDSTTHYIELFDIYESKYNCYQLDWVVQQLSSKYSYPFIKCFGTGGKEFYKLDDWTKLATFFDVINVKYQRTSIDIDNLKKNNNITPIDYANTEIIDSTNFNSHSVNIDELNLIIRNLNLDTKLELKKFQSDIRNIFNSHQSRLAHLVISPTGTGKTIIFTLMTCDYIIRDKKDIMIITKKKEILKQLPLRIENYIKLFVKSKLIPNPNYQIVDCVTDCGTEKLNTKTNESQIYIINWDKLTSSSKTNYKKINWNKFGLVIIDESHWVGSNGIYDVMTWVKEKTNVNYLGFSATPIRCSQSNQTRILDIFGNKQDYSILYDYSYYSALTNKDICPVKYQIVNIQTSDLVNDDHDGDVGADGTDNNNNNNNDNNNDNDNDNLVQYKILSPDAYLKVWKQINQNIIAKTNFKKGIFWFKSRKDLLKYYIFTKSNITDFVFFPTFSTQTTDNPIITDLIKKAELTDYDLPNSISNFIATKSNSILLSVFRFTEGSDDDRLEFGVKLFYSSSLSDPLNESQKMGRFCRWFENNPNGVKKFGYYASLEIGDNKEEIRKSLINRFKSWISFVRTNSTSNTPNNLIKPKEQIEKEIRTIIDLYVDIDTIRTFQIDIEQDIIKAYSNRTSDITKISNALRVENSKKTNGDKIDTKSKYDIWAGRYDFPTSDELIESGFNDFTKLFGLDVGEYLSWGELKKLCAKYQNKYTSEKPIDIYRIMKNENKGMPDEPEEFYKSKFTSFNDLF
jgi:hypothetical protein